MKLGYLLNKREIIMFAHSLIMIITKISEIIHMEICVRYCTNEHRYSYHDQIHSKKQSPELLAGIHQGRNPGQCPLPSPEIRRTRINKQLDDSAQRGYLRHSFVYATAAHSFVVNNQRPLSRTGAQSKQGKMLEKGKGKPPAGHCYSKANVTWTDSYSRLRRAVGGEHDPCHLHWQHTQYRMLVSKEKFRLSWQ